MTDDTDNTLKPRILYAALQLAQSQGLFKFARSQVASRADVGDATVSYHFGTMQKLRAAVVKLAIEREVISVLADLQSSREALGVVVPEELKVKVAQHMAR